MAKPNWTPWMRIEDYRERMERLAEESLAGSGPAEKNGYTWTPAADAFESGDEYVIQVELPGLAIEDVRVEVRGGGLWIYGERPYPKDSDHQAYQLLERSYGPFARKFPLGAKADPASVKAVLREGLLTVSIRKKDSDPSRRRIVVHTP